MNYSLTKLWKRQREERKQNVLDSFGKIDGEEL